MSAEVATPVGLGRPFAWLWASTAASGAGDGLVRATLPLLVVAAAGRGASEVAAVSTAGYLPWLLVALPVGVLVDRVDRRRILVLGNLLRVVALLAAALFVPSGLSLAGLVVLAAVLGTAEVLVDSAAPAVLPALVRPEQLERANARLFLPQVVLNDLLGPAVAGVLVAASALTAVLTSSLAYLVAALVLSVGALGGVAVRPTAPPAEESMSASLRAGLLFIRRDRVLVLVLAGSGLFALTYAAMFAMLVVVARDQLGLGPAGYGLLLSTAAVGALAGSLVASRVSGTRLAQPMMLASLPVAGLAYVLIGLAEDPVVAVLALGVAGIATMTWNVAVVSLRQRRTPSQLQGRVGSVNRLLSWGLMPLGAALAGVVAAGTSASTVLLGAGLLLSAGSLALLGLLRSCDLG